MQKTLNDCLDTNLPNLSIRLYSGNIFCWRPSYQGEDPERESCTSKRER